MNISLPPFAPENLVSRDGFGCPVPRQSAHLHTQAESGAFTYGIPPDFRGGVCNSVVTTAVLRKEQQKIKVASIEEKSNVRLADSKD